MELSAAAAACCVSIGATARTTISGPPAAVFPAVTPPSQYASRFSMGRGREIKRRAMPRRTGSHAAMSATTRTVLHMRGALPSCDGFHCATRCFTAACRILQQRGGGGGGDGGLGHLGGDRAGAGFTFGREDR